MLVCLNGFKKRLEVPCTKALCKKEHMFLGLCFDSEQNPIFTDVVILTHRLMCCKSCEWRPHLVVMSLNDLQEHSGAILNWLCEDLK